ncbi:hypothetical protein AGR5A_Cc90029 [Agrobacterium genomosp. 5 str. CFBP 6626]|nr:hypothetical protein AGR5A_Cc90029 [Agrobacterium genomosp. 5 str. CFBP 6626]
MSGDLRSGTISPLNATAIYQTATIDSADNHASLSDTVRVKIWPGASPKWGCLRKPCNPAPMGLYDQ